MNKPLFPEITVNGQTISAASIAAEAQNHPAPKGKPGLAWRSGAKALVVRQLLLEEAEKLAITPAPETDEDKRTETEEESIIRALLDACIVPDTVDEADVRAAYDADPSRYRGPSLFQPAHILITGNDPDAAKVQATAVLTTVLEKPREFAHLAKAESACSSRDAGGELGQLNSGDTVPEFERALREATVGEIFPELVETRYGYHIVRLDARADGEILPYETVKSRLVEAAEKRAWTHAADAFIATLVDKAEIVGIDLKNVA